MRSSSRSTVLGIYKNNDSPIRLLIITTVCMFFAELLASAILLVFPSLSGRLIKTLSDALLSTVFVLPLLYIFMLNPLRTQIAERKRAEEALQAAHDQLEIRVEERTKELAQANASLQKQIEIGEQLKATLINYVEELERLAAIVESSDDAIIGKTIDGTITSWNLGAERIYGYSCEEATGKNITFLSPPDQSEEVLQILRRVSTGEQIHHYETSRQRKDGDVIYVSLSMFPIRDSTGKIIGAASIARDITRRKKAEEALQKAYDELGTRVQERTMDLAKAIEELQAEIAERKKVEEQLRILYRAELQARRVAETLRSASLALTQTLDLNMVSRTLLEYISHLVPYESASVILFEDETYAKVWATSGYENLQDPERELSKVFHPQENPWIRALLENQQTILIPDVEQEIQWNSFSINKQIRNWLGVPLIAGGRLIGLCELSRSEANFFTQEHIRWIEALSGQTAVMIQNTWLFEQVRSGRERLQSLSRRLVEIQENERGYIARELHDEAGQMLTSLMIGLELLEREASHPEAVQAGVAELNGLVDSVMDNLHRLAVDLRPASLDHLGLVAALRQYIEAVSEKHRVLFNFEVMGLNERLPEEVESALYRITQEAITNVIRHANATRIDILIEQRGERVVVIIEDNGTGFDPAALTHPEKLGLIGMRERAEMLGGSLTIESESGNGTNLFVEVPCVYSNTSCG